MRYQVQVYCEGPKSAFSGKPDPSEVIHVAEAPWRWLARTSARANLGNQGRCGYAIFDRGQMIEHEAARKPYAP